MNETKRQCSCSKCAGLCSGQPGWFMPGQATAAARSMGMGLRGFFQRYLIVEFWAGMGDTFVLAPRRDFQRGVVADWGDAFLSGRCLLLGPAGCLLPVELRPHECAVVFGCQEDPPDDGPGNRIRREIKDAWARQQDELVECLSPEELKYIGIEKG